MQADSLCDGRGLSAPSYAHCCAVRISVANIRGRGVDEEERSDSLSLSDRLTDHQPAMQRTAIAARAFTAAAASAARLPVSVSSSSSSNAIAGPSSSPSRIHHHHHHPSSSSSSSTNAASAAQLQWHNHTHARRRDFHGSSTSRARFSFDTAAFVSRLEQEGLSRKQSTGLVEALEEVVEESIRTMTANLVTRAEQEKHQYTQKAGYDCLMCSPTPL